MDWLSDPQAWIALVTLTALEIVLGIDNIIFISILAGKLPRAPAGPRPDRSAWPGHDHPDPAAALHHLDHAADRAALLVLGHAFSGRDLILIVGGLFLLAKSTIEIHDKLEGGGAARLRCHRRALPSAAIIIQIIDPRYRLLAGFGHHRGRAWPASCGHGRGVVIAVAVMMLFFAGAVSAFVDRHPTIKMLALSLPAADRRRRWSPRAGAPHPQGLHLLRHGLLGARGDAQPESKKECRTTGETAPAPRR